jgi:hypothetical protein
MKNSMLFLGFFVRVFSFRKKRPEKNVITLPPPPAVFDDKARTAAKKVVPLTKKEIKEGKQLLKPIMPSINL